MSNFCINCGSELEPNATYCANCGTKVEGNNNSNSQNDNTYQVKKVTNRNIALAIILSIITCGLYNLYWICSLTDDVNFINDEENDTSGVLTIVFGIVTCGIYLFYWNYIMGRKMYSAGQRNNKNITDNSIIYLLLSLFGLSLVNCCLIQNDLNNNFS